MTAYEAMSKSIEDIQARLKEHECLLNGLKEGCEEADLDFRLVSCPHKRRLTETLLKTVEVLEESRKAFKSKQLEALRKRLIEVLVENT
ncbi:MAG: hypothetical protein KJ970_04130 [Candidatus Eisenbacteria bacterium]|uniref:Uncharacterized protein n=1 Tax=Eiseniibacteriota bacterium TaxID=2212470 RepID=A0A948RV91_UNCEI|nr:hypothetical protein [Candidatus Eisenbacteria bacterium]MBU1950426.1 hypothetical protein [Candidatus Eisenbacteria bacterium]MBU2690092.1 hypothetical protein [Candidatus Eisenbacteria bacterium]